MDSFYLMISTWKRLKLTVQNSKQVLELKRSRRCLKVLISIAWVLAGKGLAAWVAAVATALGVLAVLLIGFDLTLHVMNPVTYPWITREVFPELKEEKQFLRENVGLDRVHILHRKHDWKNFLLNSNFGMVERIRETSGYESLALQRYAEFCAYLETGDRPSYIIPFTGAFRWTSESINPRLLNLLGARLIVDDPGRDLYPAKAPSGKVFSASSSNRRPVFITYPLPFSRSNR